MTIRPPAIAIAAVAAALSVSVLAAQRTFVASTGIDTNPCSLTQPCRSFTVAIAATASGGEVVVLDSAGYGPVTITQPVSIVAPPGVYAGVTAFSGEGISVLGAAGDRVRLRGLRINGLGGTRGIWVKSAAVVDVADVEISGFRTAPGLGIDLQVAGSRLAVADTTFSQNSVGIRALATGTRSGVSVERSRFVDNMIGIGLAGDALSALVRDTRFTHNDSGAIATAVSISNGAVALLDGIHVVSQPFDGVAPTSGVSATSTATRVAITRSSILGGYVALKAHDYARVDVTDVTIEGVSGYETGWGAWADEHGEIHGERLTVTGTANGVVAFNSSVVRISDCLVTRNNTGVLVASGGAVESRSTNSIRGNGTDVQNSGGTVTTFAAQ